MSENFRELSAPIRTCTISKKSNSAYKPHLRKDFNERCGYCDCHDEWYSGDDFFQVDHFKPKKHFDELKFMYSNLVYSCPYCNRAKSDDWYEGEITIDHERGYIDPCSLEYEKLFERSSSGKIIPKTKLSRFLYFKLKFYLKRHEVIWKLRRMESVLNNLNLILESGVKLKNDDENILSTNHRKITTEFIKYLKLKNQR